jgi:tagatose 1,6-diphosphate aldolase GatY/KbaY
MRGYRMGFSSIMIDGSKRDYEGNVALTRRVVEACSASGVPVEGELGSIGGKEDDHEANAAYTDPTQAADYVERTGVQSLAVAIGTAHGVYKTAPKLDVERLAAIRDEVSVPLVLHGSSGLTDDAVRACVERGACKVNFATEVRQAFTAAALGYLTAHPEEFDLRVYLAPAIEAVTSLCKHRIAVCGAAGKA